VERAVAVRILLSAYACHPRKGSEAGNSWNWAVNLVDMGHEVWVLTGHRTDAAEDRLERAGAAGAIPGLRIVDIRLSPAIEWLTQRGNIGVYLHYVLWLRESLRRARALHGVVKFDVVHHVSWGSLMWGSPLWRFDTPFVFGPVGGGQRTPSQLRKYFYQGWWKERIRSTMIHHILPAAPWVRATIKNASLVLATNAETLRIVQHVGAVRSRLVIDTAVPPSFVDRDRKPLRVVNDPLRIVWVGRLVSNKGLPLALDSVGRIGSDVPWHLTIVGDGPQRPHLAAMLQDLRVRGHVTYLGGVEWEAMREIYERSNVMLFTSLRDSSGAQLYEALAFGLPIVGLDHQGQRDILPAAASIKVPIEPGVKTAELLADALETIGRDPKRRSRMSAAALQFATRSTWSGKVQDVYSEVKSLISSATTNSQDEHVAGREGT
jgi:glycosyltransferase involved in cell wall biosynthesis